MATAILQTNAPTSTEAPSEARAEQTTRTSAPSPLTAALTTAAVCIAVVWVAVTVLMMTVAQTTTLGAIGVGGFAAFWLGGGFGAIFGSAAAFGKDH